MSKTIEELYREMRDDFAARSGLSPNDSGDIALRLHAFAEQLYALWVQTEWLGRQCFPQTAIGEQLEKHAQLRGLSRGEAVCAQGMIRFCLREALEADTAIPLGCVCETAGGIAFETTQAGTIPAGSLYAEIPAAAQSAGALGNVPSGAVCIMVSPPVGVTYCLNPTAFSGGADEESDEALRSRVLMSYQRLPNGANAAFYETQALSVSGVAAAAVLPKERGIGTVDVIVSASDGIPSADLVDAVEALLQAQREICVDIAVSAPTALPINVSVELEGDGSRGFDELSDAVEDAIRAYFSGKLLGKKVTLAALGNVIYGVPGVKNYHILAPNADVASEPTELPTLGTLSVTEA